jgi:hypothetical protein
VTPDPAGNLGFKEGVRLGPGILIAVFEAAAEEFKAMAGVEVLSGEESLNFTLTAVDQFP